MPYTVIDGFRIQYENTGSHGIAGVRTRPVAVSIDRYYTDRPYLPVIDKRSATIVIRY